MCIVGRMEIKRGTAMREVTERLFRQLLEQHDTELLRSTSSDANRMLVEQEFDRRFHELGKDTIKPILEKARDLMADHGLRAAIVVAHRHTEADGKTTPSSITFEFRVLTDAEVEGFPVTIPTVAFVADPTCNGVSVHENSVLPYVGGHIGVIDRCSFAEFTGDIVEKHLLAVAQKVLRGTGAS